MRSPLLHKSEALAGSEVVGKLASFEIVLKCLPIFNYEDDPVSIHVLNADGLQFFVKLAHNLPFIALGDEAQVLSPDGKWIFVPLYSDGHLAIVVGEHNLAGQANGVALA